MASFAGKVVIVTGSTSGMGEAIARRFAADGAGVVVNSARSVEPGQRLAGELPDAIYVQADVSVPADADRLIDAAVDRWGRLDVLVNNAAIAPMVAHADLDGLTDDIWDETFAVNLLGPWRLARAAAPALRRDGGGAIVNISSLAAIRPTENSSSIAYHISKSALNHLTVLLADVLGPEITVNALAPGRIETPIWGALREQLLATAADVVPLGRAGQPADIADVCYFLAQPGYVTGQVIVVDGGMGIKVRQLSQSS